MKNLKFIILTTLLCTSFLFSSCIGSFGLWNNLKEWNENVGDKFVNELVFFSFNIIPVYPVCYLVDVLVLNSIEFWTGENPMAKVGETQKINSETGEFTVTTLKNGYSINKKGEKETIKLLFNADQKTWSASVNNQTTPLLTFKDDNTADIYLRNGETINITLDQEGKKKIEKIMLNQSFSMK
jgi:hypothetical protein